MMQTLNRSLASSIARRLLLIAAALFASAARAEEAQAPTTPKYAPPISAEILELLKKHNGYPVVPGLRWVYERVFGEIGIEECYFESTSAPPQGGLPITFFKSFDLIGGNNVPLFWTQRGYFVPVDGTLELMSGDWVAGRPMKRAIVIPAKLEKGLRWSQHVNTPAAFHIGFDATVADFRRISTPAGEFDAFAILYKPVGSGHLDWVGWFVPNVGFVRIDHRAHFFDLLGTGAVRTSWLLKRIESSSIPRRFGDSTLFNRIADLPAHVACEPNRVSLYADYNASQPGRVILYFINNTDNEKRFETKEPGSFFLHQEFQDAVGNWVRSEAVSWRRRFEEFTLPPRSYRIALGWRATEGRTAKIRYRVHQEPEFVSNAAVGLVNDAEIILSRHDRVAIDPDKLTTAVNLLLSNMGLSEYSLPPADRTMSPIHDFTLPPGEEVRILRQCIVNGCPIEYANDVFERLSLASEKECADAIKSELTSRLVGRQLYGISYFRWGLDTFRKSDDRDIARILQGLLHKSLDEWSREILESIAFLPNGFKYLQAIAEDPQYDYSLRSRANHIRYIRSRDNEFNRQEVYLARFAATLTDLAGKKGIRIWVRNVSEEELQFEYADLHEIFEFQLFSLPSSILSEQRNAVVAPKREIKWFAPPDAGRQLIEVSIPPGKEHLFEIELSDYYDLVQLQGIILCYVRLPGIHKFPKSCDWMIDLDGPSEGEEEKEYK